MVEYTKKAKELKNMYETTTDIRPVESYDKIDSIIYPNLEKCSDNGSNKARWDKKEVDDND